MGRGEHRAHLRVAVLRLVPHQASGSRGGVAPSSLSQEVWGRFENMLFQCSHDTDAASGRDASLDLEGSGVWTGVCSDGEGGEQHLGVGFGVLVPMYQRLVYGEPQCGRAGRKDSCEAELRYSSGQLGTCPWKGLWDPLLWLPGVKCDLFPDTFLLKCKAEPMPPELRAK